LPARGRPFPWPAVVLAVLAVCCAPAAIGLALFGEGGGDPDEDVPEAAVALFGGVAVLLMALAAWSWRRGRPRQARHFELTAPAHARRALLAGRRQVG
jgi:hypothetical protein